jgi:hypothetical protein
MKDSTFTALVVVGLVAAFGVALFAIEHTNQIQALGMLSIIILVAFGPTLWLIWGLHQIFTCARTHKNHLQRKDGIR